MRLFLAIDLPDDVKSHLAAAQQQWQEHCGPHRPAYPAWTKPANLHVTLKFLGDVPDPAPLVTRLQSLQPLGPFPLRTGAIQYFPPRGPARVIAVHLDGDTGRLHQLASSLESLCELESIPRERRPFNPHITIGRSRTGVSPRHPGGGPLNWPDPSRLFPATHLTLYQSHLHPTGPEYTSLATFPL